MAFDGQAVKGRRAVPTLAAVIAVLVSAVLLTALSACTSASQSDEASDQDATGGATADQQAAAAAAPTTEPPPLEFLAATETVYCDGSDRIAGEIRGAFPGETIVLASALPIELERGLADDQGRFTLPWNCEHSEARLRWDITAIGHDSGRRVALTIVGSDRDPELANQLAINVSAEPFICDGTRRRIGDLSGAEPFEKIVFQSEQSNNLSDGQADDTGASPLFWQCSVDQADSVWLLTVRGAQSNKVGEFTITAAPFTPALAPEPTVEIIENPFQCDGGTRPFAKLSGLVPFEVVDFSSNDASGLIDGRADNDGSLTVRWQCGRDDIGKVWLLLAEGVQSGRTVSLTVDGGNPPEGTYKDLAIAYDEDPFVCDGDSRHFATLTNFLTREFVDFDSPEAGPMRQGQADETGALPIRWQCDPDDAGKLWQVTATGATSKKAITFTVTAAP